MSDRIYPALRWADITASDTAYIEPTPASVHVGTGGVVVAEGDDGVTSTFTVGDGAVLGIQPRRILATGTTASGLVALYN